MNKRPEAAMFYFHRWGNSHQIELYSWAAQGFIVKLMTKAWADDDCSLPDNDTLFAKWFGCPLAEWMDSEVRACVVDFFQACGPGRRANAKQRELFAHEVEAMAQATYRGRNAAGKRWGSNAECNGNADAMRTHEQPQSASNANPMHPGCEGRKEGRKEKTPIAPKGAEVIASLRADFDAFWNVWPRKVCKDAAEKAFAKAIKAAPLATILAGVEAGKRTDQWRKDGGQFIPHAATWLNGKRWMDEPEPEEREPFAAENDPDFVSDLLTFDPIVEAARKRATA